MARASSISKTVSTPTWTTSGQPSPIHAVWPAGSARWKAICARAVSSARYFASGWEGVVRVEVCEPPRRLLMLTTSPDEPDGVIEATLTADGDQTVLVIEDRGLPLEQIAAYGAGDQIHIEDLAAYLDGRERCDARARWQELHPAYQDLAADLT